MGNWLTPELENWSTGVLAIGIQEKFTIKQIHYTLFPAGRGLCTRILQRLNEAILESPDS
jgi:hypothetical protein